MNKNRVKKVLELIREECEDVYRDGRIKSRVLTLEEGWFVRDIGDKCEELLEKLEKL